MKQTIPENPSAEQFTRLISMTAERLKQAGVIEAYFANKGDENSARAVAKEGRLLKKIAQKMVAVRASNPKLDEEMLDFGVSAGLFDILIKFGRNEAIADDALLGVIKWSPRMGSDKEAEGKLEHPAALSTPPGILSDAERIHDLLDKYSAAACRLAPFYENDKTNSRAEIFREEMVHGSPAGAGGNDSVLDGIDFIGDIPHGKRVFILKVLLALSDCDDARRAWVQAL